MASTLEFLQRISRGDVPSEPRDRSPMKALHDLALVETEDDGRVVLTDAGWQIVEKAA